MIAQTANEGLAVAAHIVRSAILLDVNLPDHSGLGVLDQLKRNPRTRHIPVHVVSVADFSREALRAGRGRLRAEAGQARGAGRGVPPLEAKLAQGLRRVLVVEDDARQRESITQLLDGAGRRDRRRSRMRGRGARALQATTFDCMVMDLNLPDLSGYDLLEPMAEQDDVSFPPVIVYTGRSLTRDEEQRLRRYSRSIIIKDARSPERLLDEVTLFLHQVESSLPPERQRMLKAARDREAALDGRRILVVEDDVRNVFALTSCSSRRARRWRSRATAARRSSALERCQGSRGDAPSISC